MSLNADLHPDTAEYTVTASDSDGRELSRFTCNTYAMFTADGKFLQHKYTTRIAEWMASTSKKQS